MTADPSTVWVLDDDESIRFVLQQTLSAEGLSVALFSTLSEINDALSDSLPDAVIADVKLPDGDGLSMLDSLHERQIPVIVMTAYSDLDLAVQAFQQGAFEYLSKPFDLDTVIATVRKACAAETRKPKPPPAVRSELLGDSPAMQEVFRTIGRLSRSEISVLITGETGTGKELVAQALHRHSRRAAGPFIAINTAAIPADLLESELFGHEKGAFTGAIARRTGRFEEARGGTLFLDEIGDMPLALQTRLLRVLAEGDYYRVGGRDLLRADVRVIAATHQDLAQHVADGGFREDLFHRLNVIRIHLPPLRERHEDIGMLAEHFLSLSAREMQLERKELRPETLKLLQTHDWPGNVRQLQNLCRQLCVMAPGEQIFPHDLPFSPSAEDTRQETDWSKSLEHWAERQLALGKDELLSKAGRAFDRVLIRAALRQTGGNKREAARLLGCSRNTLARKLKDLS